MGVLESRLNSRIKAKTVFPQDCCSQESGAAQGESTRFISKINQSVTMSELLTQRMCVIRATSLAIEHPKVCAHG
ncbi:MAG: hypothetical protein FWF25_01210 [Propionibacteriaceae bacterium]|nr:hypothetical protein [Propionibacteriaceae bacterium]